MTELIKGEIVKANQFADAIEDLIIARGQCPTGERNTLLMAHWSLTFELNRSVLCLVDHDFCGGAFALIRPIVESVVRAHVVVMGRQQDMEQLQNDSYRTNFSTIGKVIDDAFNMQEFFQTCLRRSTKSLHSYTHAGTLQLSRRFSGTDLLPNYPEQEIIEAIRVCASAAFMVNNLATKHLGFIDEWEKCTELFHEWGK